MTTNQLTKSDQKMLDDLKIKSTTKTKLLIELFYYRFFKIISTLFAMFFFTLLIFAISYIIYVQGFGFSLYAGLFYVLCHYIFFNFYLKKRYNKTMQPLHYLMMEAESILSFRLQNKLYDD